MPEPQDAGSSQEQLGTLQDAPNQRGLRSRVPSLTPTPSTEAGSSKVQAKFVPIAPTRRIKKETVEKERKPRESGRGRGRGKDSNLSHEPRKNTRIESWYEGRGTKKEQTMTASGPFALGPAQAQAARHSSSTSTVKAPIRVMDMSSSMDHDVGSDGEVDASLLALQQQDPYAPIPLGARPPHQRPPFHLVKKKEEENDEDEPMDNAVEEGYSNSRVKVDNRHATPSQVLFGGLEEPNPEDLPSFHLLQFPSVLPEFANQDDPFPDAPVLDAPVSEAPAEDTLMRDEVKVKDEPMDEDEDMEPMPVLKSDRPAGLVGYLTQHASGKIQFHLGNMAFDVHAAPDCSFEQHVVSLQTEEPASATIVAASSKRFVCTPDMDALLASPRS